MRQSVANLGADGDFARAVAEMDVQGARLHCSPPTAALAAVECPLDPYVHLSGVYLWHGIIGLLAIPYR